MPNVSRTLTLKDILALTGPPRYLVVLSPTDPTYTAAGWVLRRIQRAMPNVEFELRLSEFAPHGEALIMKDPNGEIGYEKGVRWGRYFDGDPSPALFRGYSGFESALQPWGEKQAQLGQIHAGY